MIFFLSLLGTFLLAGSLFFLTITIQKADGQMARSDWPQLFTDEFKEQIIFIDMVPRIKQSGIAALQDNGIGLQLLDVSGHEVFSYQKPEQADTAYSSICLLYTSPSPRD